MPHPRLWKYFYFLKLLLSITACISLRFGNTKPNSHSFKCHPIRGLFWPPFKKQHPPSPDTTLTAPLFFFKHLSSSDTLHIYLSAVSPNKMFKVLKSRDLVLFTAITVPDTWQTLNNYLLNEWHTALSTKELQVLLSDDVIYTVPSSISEPDTNQSKLIQSPNLSSHCHQRHLSSKTWSHCFSVCWPPNIPFLFFPLQNFFALLAVLVGLSIREPSPTQGVAHNQSQGNPPFFAHGCKSWEWQKTKTASSLQ